MTVFAKDPAAVLDYAVDWDAGYLDGRQIVTSTWAVAPAGAGAMTVTGSQVAAGRTAATLAGGRAGHVYRITNQVTLSDGRVDERTVVVRVEER